MSETTRLKLFKHDNPASNTNPFNVTMALNENWDKIDEAQSDMIKIFNSIGEMKLDTSLQNGDTCQTLGYNTKNDGNFLLYNIVSDNSLVADDYDIIDLENGLKAIRINQKAEIKIHFPLTSNSSEHPERSGNCQIIQTQNKNMLIDLGYQPSGELLLNYLSTNNINKIDYILISHFHDDHMGGGTAAALSALLNSSSVDTSNCIFILPPQLDGSKFIGQEYTTIENKISIVKNLIENAGLTYIVPTEGQELKLDIKTKVKIYNTEWNNDYYNATIRNGVDTGATIYNNFSLVVELTNNNVKGLLPGDLEEFAQGEIYKKLSNYDFYVIAHHSANAVVDRSFFAKVKPKVCAIVCSMQSHYLGTHNTSDVKEERMLFQVLGVPVYTTYESGNIAITSNGDNIKVVSENGNVFTKNQNNMDFFRIGFGIDNDFYLNLASETDLDNIENGSWTTTSDAIGSSIVNQPIANHGSFRITQRNISKTFLKYQILQYARQGELGLWYRNQYGAVVEGVATGIWNNWKAIAFTNSDNVLGTSINSNDNLDNYLTPGNFVSPNSATTNSLSNCPITGTGFKMEVEYLTSTNIIRQTIKSHSALSDTYIRTRTAQGGGQYSWQSWHKISLV